MDNNGIPTIETGKGVFADTDAQNAIRSVQTPQVSIGNVAEGILQQAPTETNLVIDPYARRIFGVANTIRDNAGCLVEVNPVKTLVIGPVTGQTGRSLEWEEKSMDSGFPAAVEAIVDAILADVTPKRSVESLVSAILAAIPDETETADIPVIIVDQSSGSVTIGKPTNRATLITSLQGVVTGATDGVELTLSEPTPEAEDAPLIFEGGSTD